MGVLHNLRRTLIVQFPNLDLIPPLCQQTLGPRSKIVAKSVEQAHLPFAAEGVCSVERERSDTELSPREKTGYSEREISPEEHEGHEVEFDFQGFLAACRGVTQ